MITRFLAVIWDVNPTFFRIGSFEIRYYGLLWALAFLIGTVMFVKFVRREGLPDKVWDSIFWYGTISTIVGSRLGHCLFYDPVFYLTHPLEILDIRGGGMASHGAAVGLLIGLWLFSRKNRLPYLWSLDRIMIPVAIGGAGVRIGNLINSEIYGHVTDLPWGFVFVRAGETLPKHPTQIYEALCYLALFGLLCWMYFRRDDGRRHPGLMFGTGLIGIFLPRILIEFIKNPQVNFEAGMALNMGQWLSIPFILLGVGMIFYGLRHKAVPTPAPAKAAAPLPRSVARTADNPQPAQTGKHGTRNNKR